MAKSWHIPYISTLRMAPPNECINVIFLERIPEDTRTKVLESLKEDIDHDWAAQFDPDFKPRTLVEIPWIRDYWPSSDVILDIAANNKQLRGTDADDTYDSFILVDSGWDAGMVVAAQWAKDSSGDRRLEAARVPLNQANALLTLVTNGSLKNLEEGLGESYDEVKVDFYKDLKWEKANKKTEDHAYEPPVFLPKDLKLCESQPEIIALLKIDDDKADSILESLNSHHDAAEGHTAVKKIHRWEGPSPTRTDLISLFKWMESNTPEDEGRKNGHIFFLDYLLKDENGDPRLLAASRPAIHVDDVHLKEQITLLPLKYEQFFPFCKEVFAGGDGERAMMDHGRMWARERIVDTKKPLIFDPDLSCPPVFYLCPFSQDQERQIRDTFNGLANDSGADSMDEFAYLGPLCPNSEAKHTMEDIRDLLESSDRKSPYFKEASPVRVVSYPSHFIAIDERILDPEPQCILASSLDFSDDRYDNIGWLYGDVDADEAHINYVNLDVANMGPDEMFESKKLWLSDLKEYRKHDYINEDEDEEDEEEDAGDENGNGEKQNDE